MESFEEFCRINGLPDATINLYDVPESEQAGLRGAALACEHVVKNATTGKRTIVRVVNFGDKKMALCTACAPARAAGAGN
jgi:hypothetical protein